MTQRGCGCSRAAWELAVVRPGPRLTSHRCGWEPRPPRSLPCPCVGLLTSLPAPAALSCQCHISAPGESPLHTEARPACPATS